MKRRAFSKTAARAFAGAGLALLLAACSSQPARSRDEIASPMLMREFTAKGYTTVNQAAVTTTLHSWIVMGRPVRIVLSRPQRLGSAPLVVYVPGMGEPSDAGEKWRSAWSSAGYAVMSVQVLEEDASAWRSELAREGDFKGLGRQRYAGAVMGLRVKVLEDVIDEARRRAALGDTAWQGVDWTTLAIAGFDLGAYTAMTLAGEQVPGVAEVAGSTRRSSLRAAIALSPYASLATGSSDGRYGEIRIPVLSVTSDRDGDLLGLVEASGMRSRPYERMDGPDKFLLSLQGLPHAGFSGSPAETHRSAEGGPARSSQAGGANQGSGDGGQRRRGGGKRPGSDDSDRSGGGRSPRGEGAGSGAGREGAGPGAGQEGAGPGAGQEGAGPGARGLSPDAVQMREIAAQAISTAFLDAYLKDDPRARAWLSVDANRWLDGIGELRRK